MPKQYLVIGVIKMTNQESNHNIQLLSAKELGKLLSLSKRQVFRLKACHLIPKPVKISGAVRWKMSDIQFFIQECNCNMAEYNARREVEKC